MSNVKLQWTLPSVGGNQRPHDFVLLEAQVDGAPDFTEIARVLAVDPPEHLLADVASGLWHFQGTVVDVDGNAGPPAQVSLQVPFDPPSALETFTAVLE